MTQPVKSDHLHFSKLDEACTGCVNKKPFFSPLGVWHLLLICNRKAARRPPQVLCEIKLLLHQRQEQRLTWHRMNRGTRMSDHIISSATNGWSDASMRIGNHVLSKENAAMQRWQGADAYGRKGKRRGGEQLLTDWILCWYLVFIDIGEIFMSFAPKQALTKRDDEKLSSLQSSSVCIPQQKLLLVHTGTMHHIEDLVLHLRRISRSVPSSKP